MLVSSSESLQPVSRSLRAATAGVLIALLLVSCGSDTPGVSTTSQSPGSRADLEALATRVCVDLGEGTILSAAVIEDAVIQALEISFSSKELGEALTAECPGTVPATELLGTK